MSAKPRRLVIWIRFESKDRLQPPAALRFIIRCQNPATNHPNLHASLMQELSYNRSPAP